MKHKGLKGLKDLTRPHIAAESQEPVVVSESRYGIQYLTLHGADIQPGWEDREGRHFSRYVPGEYTAIKTVGEYYVSVHLPDHATMLEFSIWYEGMVKASLLAVRLSGGWDLIAVAGSEDTPRTTMGLVGPIPISHGVNNAGNFYYVAIHCLGNDWNNIKAVQIKYELPLS
jgi:hypothetical protein